jgi:hypothetical protein
MQSLYLEATPRFLATSTIGVERNSFGVEMQGKSYQARVALFLRNFREKKASLQVHPPPRNTAEDNEFKTFILLFEKKS